MNSSRFETGTEAYRHGRRRRRRLLWHGLAREERVAENETSRVPRAVDDEITLQLLRPPALVGPLTASDVVDALRKADALLRNVPLMTEQRLVLLRWAEAWLQLGLTRLNELAMNRPPDRSRECLRQASRFSDLSHREVLGLIRQVEAGQIFELIGFARYYLCRSVAFVRELDGAGLEPGWSRSDW
jgi:hypothetical protein